MLPTQNNYAGIGALNGNAKGQAATFPDPRTGVRAQIQHLKAYASKEALVNGCVDPRFSLVTRGSAQYVEWLGASDNPNGKGWAVPGKGYGGKVVALLGQIMAFEVPQRPHRASRRSRSRSSRRISWRGLKRSWRLASSTPPSSGGRSSANR